MTFFPFHIKNWDFLLKPHQLISATLCIEISQFLSTPLYLSLSLFDYIKRITSSKPSSVDIPRIFFFFFFDLKKNPSFLSDHVCEWRRTDGGKDGEFRFLRYPDWELGDRFDQQCCWSQSVWRWPNNRQSFSCKKNRWYPNFFSFLDFKLCWRVKMDCWSNSSFLASGLLLLLGLLLWVFVLFLIFYKLSLFGFLTLVFLVIGGIWVLCIWVMIDFFSPFFYWFCACYWIYFEELLFRGDLFPLFMIDLESSNWTEVLLEKNIHIFSNPYFSTSE